MPKTPLRCVVTDVASMDHDWCDQILNFKNLFDSTSFIYLKNLAAEGSGKFFFSQNPEPK
jgi:hypothetical protein